MAEEHARWKQYEYAANSNLVLTSERRSRDNEPTVRSRPKQSEREEEERAFCSAPHGCSSAKSGRWGKVEGCGVGGVIILIHNRNHAAKYFTVGAQEGGREGGKHADI